MTFTAGALPAWRSRSAHFVATSTQSEAVVLCCRCQFLVKAYFLKFRKYGKNEVYREGPCMFLVRSAAAVSMVTPPFLKN